MDKTKQFIVDIGLQFLMATFHGSILCILYPFAVQYFVTEQGWLPAHLPWFNCICIMWIIRLFRSDKVVYNSTTILGDSKKLFDFGKKQEDGKI